MNRRQFLHAGTGAAVLSVLPDRVRTQSASTGVNYASLVVHAEAEGIRVPATFTGLSYESAQLAHPGFFSAKNKRLVAFFRRLGSQGVLRIGGDTSEYTFWTPGKTQSNDDAATGPDAGDSILTITPVTPDAIRNLGGFLDATGWKLLYGLNLGHGTSEQAAEEGAYVAKIVGSRLIALQIGNEPDLYTRNVIRPPNWSFPDYWKQWNDWAQAIRKRIPGVRLAGPDVATTTDWVESFAKQANEIVLLASHYYAEGPPSDPTMNMERLLRPDPRLQDNIARLSRASGNAHIPYRLTECNSCWDGGKEGVSDTFGSALWGADLMLFLAQAGVSGINFHGGGNGYYTPIAGSPALGFTAKPLYYGMLLFSSFIDSSLIPIALDASGANLTAYAAKTADNKLQVAIINKEMKQDARVNLNPGLAYKTARVLLMSAPSVESSTDVSLGRSGVTGDAAWKPKWRDQLRGERDELLVELPAASAALVLLD